MNSKYLSKCEHDIYTNFLKCPIPQNNHLHCFKCCSILLNEILLTFLTVDELNNTVTIHTSRQSCENLVAKNNELKIKTRNLTYK